MAEIRAQIDGEEVSFEAGTTGTEFFKDQRTIIAMRVNGEAKDLYLEIPQGATVEGIDISSDEGLAILRHSCTHVMAQAVQDINPQVNLGIGPPVKDGFYYDFGNVYPFTPEDLKEIEKRMKRIVKEGQVFRRRVVSAEEAEAELADQPYKLHLISSKGNTDAEGASVEVGGSELTMYDNRNRKDETVWTDLCRGPHIPNTKLIGNGFKLMKTSDAYRLGNQANDCLL